jgi:rhodanese-related sulfurtransferase
MFSRLFGKASGSGAMEIDHNEFVALQRDGGCVVIDVREPHEFDNGHIPGALNLPLSRFDPNELPTGRQVVLVCQAGGRSATALRRAAAAGFTDIRHYAPGTGGWRARGGPLAVDD